MFKRNSVQSKNSNKTGKEAVQTQVFQTRPVLRSCFLGPYVLLPVSDNESVPVFERLLCQSIIDILCLHATHFYAIIDTVKL